MFLLLLDDSGACTVEKYLPMDRLPNDGPTRKQDGPVGFQRQQAEPRSMGY
jgi:hypothetical protein